MKIGWLSLDEGDNDPVRFLTYFVSALKQVDGPDSEIGTTTLKLLNSTQPAVLESVIISLINEITSLDSKFVLVLDDFHLIETRSIHDVMNFWIENTPHQVHLVILTREDPPFPLARLRARNMSTELRSDDLRFSVPEATQFLNEVMGLHLDPDSVATLEERTEGWVTGLQMAALSIRNRDDVHGFIERFSGTNRYILDYLLEEVLANQSQEIRNFLLNTSILKRLTAPLCDAVLATSNQSAPILAYLEKTNLFLVPLDDNRIWYRYHQLFADLLSALRSRSSQTQTEIGSAALNSRAAKWYEKNGYPYDAIYHASLVPDIDWVERLIEQNYMEIFQQNDSASIRYWTGALSKELIYDRPSLSIHEANSSAWLGKIKEAELLLNEAEKRLQLVGATPETNELYGHLTYVRSRVTAMQGNYKDSIKLGLFARKYTPASNQALLGGIGVMLGYGYYLDGNFDHAIQTLNDTIQSGKVAGAINTTIGAYCVLARLFRIQGKMHEAYQIYDEAEAFINEMGGQHRGAKSIVDAGMAEILYEWNNLEDARAHIEEALEFIHLWSKADDTAMAFITQSRLQQINGNLSAAQISIDKGVQEINSKGVFPESRDIVETAQLKMQLAQGNEMAVNLWIRSMEERLQTENPFSFENELANITLARVYINQKKMEKAITLLTQLEESAQIGGRNGSLAVIALLKALFMKEKGEPELAAEALEKSLELAVPAGYIRIYLDEGDPVRLLIAQWLANCSKSPLQSYAEHLLSQFAFEPQAGQKPRLEISASGNLIEPLSPANWKYCSLSPWETRTKKSPANSLYRQGLSKLTRQAFTENWMWSTELKP